MVSGRHTHVSASGSDKRAKRTGQLSVTMDKGCYVQAFMRIVEVLISGT